VDINQRLIDEGFAIEYRGGSRMTTSELLNQLNEVRQSL
jgi:hypothetical protein